jgi:NAD(P)-dependent dehydrogenase (short-subunit alcohol dehydrogenase family)
VALGLDREEDFPANIEFRRFDVTDERASEQLAEEFPEIDALVNAAGVILHDNQEFSSDGFRKVMDINLGGTQLVTYAFKDALLKAQGSGRQFRVPLVSFRLIEKSRLLGEQRRGHAVHQSTCCCMGPSGSSRQCRGARLDGDPHDDFGAQHARAT